MSRRHTIFVFVPLAVLTLTASRAGADIQTSQALDVECLNQLNARQIRFDRTVDVDWQRRPFSTQPVFVTVSNGFFDPHRRHREVRESRRLRARRVEPVIRAFRNLGPGRHATVQYDAMTVVITSAGASRFGVDTSHAPVAIESIVVGSQ
jgi:hypothetical protein